MVASSPPAHLALDVAQAMEDGAQGALRLNRSLMRSVALASLVPFFLLSHGLYCSLTFVFVDYLSLNKRTYQYVGGRFLWAARDERSDAFVISVTAVAADSFVLLCLSMVATVSASSAINLGRRLTLEESFSKTRGLWREPSVARLYFTTLFLGYLLSLVALMVVVLLVAGDSLRLSTWLVLISLLLMFSSLYSGILRSVGRGAFLPEEGGRGVETLWATAVVFMEKKLQGFFIFFLSLLISHGFLLMGQRRIWGGGFHEEGISPWPLLMNTFWMLGTCGLFGYLGVLLQV